MGKAFSGAGGAAARHRVREGLREMILEGEVAPGSKLPQVQLAKRFGVSQAVIRESLLELRAVGLVEAVDNFGVFVSNLDKGMLVQVYQVREVLEGLVVRLCCDRASRGDLRVLEELAERVCELGMAGRHGEMGLLDREFHDRLMEISGNRMLDRLSESYRVFERVIRVARDFEVVRDEHLGILRAIEAGDEALAEALMRAHVRAGREAFERQMSEEPLPILAREAVGKVHG